MNITSEAINGIVGGLYQMYFECEDRKTEIKYMIQESINLSILVSPHEKLFVEVVISRDIYPKSIHQFALGKIDKEEFEPIVSAELDILFKEIDEKMCKYCRNFWTEMENDICMECMVKSNFLSVFNTKIEYFNCCICFGENLHQLSSVGESMNKEESECKCKNHFLCSICFDKMDDDRCPQCRGKIVLF